jgi:hypothetical protein
VSETLDDYRYKNCLKGRDPPTVSKRAHGDRFKF